MKKATSPQPTLLSAREIARRIQRSPSGVADAIRRLGITADAVTPNFSYYKETHIPAITAGMRAANGSKTQG